MMNSKITMITALSIIGITLLLAGGFFIYSSSIVSILIVAAIIVTALKKKELRINLSLYSVSLIMISVLYLLVSAWGIDKGMSVMGVVKFLPVFLFCVYLDTAEVKKEKIIDLLPLIGSIMTALAIVLYLIKPLRQFFSVSGRVSGTFQYPNTFAAFLLITFMMSVYKIRENKINLLHAVISLVGIYSTGSRAVMVLVLPAVAGLIYILIKEKNVSEKDSQSGFNIILIAASILCIIAVIAALILRDRLLTISTSFSTFFGRVLYWRDALPMLKDHPVGLGYYGYTYLEDSYQTAHYTVIHVHNDILQFMLDIGIIPGLIYLVLYVREIFLKDKPVIYKLILSVLLIHIMFDFDMQYISFFMIVNLFMTEEKIKKIELKPLQMIISGCTLVIITVLSIIMGLSDLMDYLGLYESSVRIWKYNTTARVHLINASDDIYYGSVLAERILVQNKYVDEAYNLMAAQRYYEGDIAGFISYQTKAIDLAPYHYKYYLDFIDIMHYAATEFLKVGDSGSAEICYEGMLDMKDRMAALKERTSPIAYYFDWQPLTEFPQEYIDEINDIENQLKSN